MDTAAVHGRPRVEVVGGSYLHTLHLGGRFRGIDVRYTPVAVATAHRRLLSDAGADAGEFSLAALCMMLDRGDRRFAALPVFPYRAFRHHAVHVRRDSPLTELTHLAGRRVAVPDYSMTAAVWVRGLLSEERGIDWRDITWCLPAEQRFDPPRDVRRTRLDSDPLDALRSGHVDALVSPAIPEFEKPPRERSVRQLCLDPMHDELEYAARLGIFPINHVVVVRRQLLEATPELGLAIVDAYAAAAQAVSGGLLEVVSLPWGWRERDLLREALGADPFENGLTAMNTRTLQTFARHLLEQGLVRRAPRIEELFITPEVTA